jgi:hypothetical protein
MFDIMCLLDAHQPLGRAQVEVGDAKKKMITIIKKRDPHYVNSG